MKRLATLALVAGLGIGLGGCKKGGDGGGDGNGGGSSSFLGSISSGSHLLFVGNRDDLNHNELYAVRFSDGAITKLNDTLAGSTGDAFSARWSPDNSAVVYAAEEDTAGLAELYVLRTSNGARSKINIPFLNGGKLRQPVSPTGLEPDPNAFRWSPDGGRVAFLAQIDPTVSDAYELFVVSVNNGVPGSIQKVNPDLPTGRTVVRFDWSPDGSRIAYNADQDTDDVFELFVVSMSALQTAEKINDPMTTAPAQVVIDFAWSPSIISSQLCFMARNMDLAYNNNELFLATIGTPTTVSRVNPLLSAGEDIGGFYGYIVAPYSGPGHAFSWSPEGSRIAYAADMDTDDVTELYVTSVSALGFATKISDTLPAFGSVTEVIHAYRLKWSPNGSQVGYVVGDTGVQRYELYVANADGSGSPIVTHEAIPNGQSVYQFEWSPNGAYLAFIADKDTNDIIELYLVSTSALGTSTKLSHTLTTPSNDLVVNFSWSPNSDRIAYMAQESLVQDLYISDLTPGNAYNQSQLLVPGELGGTILNPEHRFSR